jgi:DNA-binding transcriptional LysR family regulator
MDYSQRSGSTPRLLLPRDDDSVSTNFSTQYAGIMTFLTVASEGSFANASRRLGVGRSAVSRSIQRLEAHLKTRLFLRTTRTTKLTEDGERFFENCHRGVAHISDALEEMFDRQEGSPRGRIRISSSMAFGRRIVEPLVDKFIEMYPGVRIELLLEDRPTDFASDQIDVSFRMGRVKDSLIVAKSLQPMRMATVAAPSYVATHGLPETPESLADHKCVNYQLWDGRRFEWEFTVDGLTRRFQPKTDLMFNDTELVLRAALRGKGLAQLAGYLIRSHIDAKDLLVVLPEYAPEDRAYFLCYLSRQHMPSRVRKFIDFMTDEIRAINFNDFA